MREFSTYNEGLVALRAWLVAEGVTQVVIEATGVYWRPVWHVLEEEASLELLLANARHVKNLPGRKTDVADAGWLAQLLECGLLRGSFVPPKDIARLRDLTRYRTNLVRERARRSSASRSSWKTPGSSSTRSSPTCPASRRGPWSRPSSPANVTPRCWPTWPSPACGRRSPSCAKH